MTYHCNITTGGAGAATQLELSGQTTIGSLYQRFYAMTGFKPSTMKVKVNGTLVSDSDMAIQDLSSSTNVSIEVTGQSEFGDLNDVTGVQKYELDDADYDSRTGTIRELKRKMGIPVKGEIQPKEEPEPEGIEAGQRCEVEMADHSHHRGTVRYVGKTAVAKGYWVGVELDLPEGKNDGSLKGNRYFTCGNNYGVFVKPAKCKVGDYPPIDYEAELEEELQDEL